LASIGLSRLADEARRGGVLVQVGAALLAIGGLWMVAGRAIFEAIVYALSSTDTTASAQSLDQIGNSAGAAIFIPLLLALVAGPIVLSLGLGRMGITTRGWAPSGSPASSCFSRRKRRSSGTSSASGR
jgi:hypothetical protein